MSRDSHVGSQRFSSAWWEAAGWGSKENAQASYTPSHSGSLSILYRKGYIPYPLVRSSSTTEEQ